MTVRILNQTLITLLMKLKNIFSGLQEKLLGFFLCIIKFIRLKMKKVEISVCTIYYNDFFS